MPPIPVDHDGDDLGWTNSEGIVTGKRPGAAKARKRRRNSTSSSHHQPTASTRRRFLESSATPRQTPIRRIENPASPPEERQLSYLSPAPFGVVPGLSSPPENAYTHMPYEPDPVHNLDYYFTAGCGHLNDMIPSTQRLTLLPGEAGPGFEPPPPNPLPLFSGVLAEEPEQVGDHNVNFKTASGYFIQGRGILDKRRQRGWVSESFCEKLGIQPPPPNPSWAGSALLTLRVEHDSHGSEEKFLFEVYSGENLDFCLGLKAMRRLGLITTHGEMIGLTGGEYFSPSHMNQVDYGLQSPPATDYSAILSQYGPNTKELWRSPYSNELGFAPTTQFSQAGGTGTNPFGSFQAQLAQTPGSYDCQSSYAQNIEAAFPQQGDVYRFPPL